MEFANTDSKIISIRVFLSKCKTQVFYSEFSSTPKQIDMNMALNGCTEPGKMFVVSSKFEEEKR